MRTTRSSVTFPTTISAKNDSVSSNSLSNTRFFPEDRPLSRGGVLPPIGHSFPSSVSQQPQGQQPSQIVTRASGNTNSYQSGIYSFPKTPPLQGQGQTKTGQDINPNHGHYVTPLSVASSRVPQWNMPRSPEFHNTGGHYSAPLPPIGTSPKERHANLSADVDRAYRSSLPDPWPVLDESEQSFVCNIASMGFPTPRVSRAVQRLGMKDSEVMEFLLATQELCEMSYPADIVEVALGYTNTEKAKAVEFLELVKKFKEYGFKENNILDCLQAANNDGDKALEYLMSLSST